MHAKILTCFAVLALCIGLTPAVAQATAPLVGSTGMTEGWTQADDGLWQRIDDAGHFQTLAVGPGAPELALADLRASLPALVDAYLSDPTEELGVAIDRMLDHIAALEEKVAQQAAAGELGLRSLQPPDPKVPVLPACDITVSVGADAYPTNCGAGGDASVSYQNSCNQVCLINSYAYAQARTCAGQLLSSSDSCSDQGVNISCSSATGEAGVNDCYSYASAYIYCDVLGSVWDYYLTTNDSNSSCTSPHVACLCPVPAGS